jgi:hypothetical protein
MSRSELTVLILAALGAFTFGASYALSRSPGGAPAGTSGPVRPTARPATTGRPMPAEPDDDPGRVTGAAPLEPQRPRRVAAVYDTSAAEPSASAGTNVVRRLNEPVKRLHEGN